MVIYRVPDALDAATQQLYNDIEMYSPSLLAGDFNIDYRNKKNKDAMQQKLLRHKQIVKEYTRVGIGRNRKETRTCIDHIWIIPAMCSKFKCKVADNNISDHRIIHGSMDANIPPRTVALPVKVDRFRRYFPKRGVDWPNFILDFDRQFYSSRSTDEYYDALVKSIINGCEQAGIIHCDFLPPRRVPRFNISRETKQCIRFRDQLRYKWKCARDTLNMLCYGRDHEPGFPECTIEIQCQTELVEKCRADFCRVRNISNKMAKNDRRRFLYNALKHENDNIKALWALINRTKGIVKKCVEDTTEQKFSTEAMAQFYWERSQIALGPGESPDLDFEQNLPVFESLKIPGLEKHDASLHLKMEIPFAKKTCDQ